MLDIENIELFLASLSEEDLKEEDEIIPNKDDKEV
jgi:hypothetical protein